jgi:hypothetical protein
MNYEGQKIRSLMNLGASISIARPYRSALKYQDYKKNVNPNVHVKVINANVKTNGKIFEEYIINAFNTMKETTSNWCHNYMLKFLGPRFRFA